MNKTSTIANAILWAAAIVASAVVHAPAILTTVLLPALWAGTLLIAREGPCRSERPSD